MVDYTTFKAIDLLLDESFLQYCKGNEEAIALWNAYLLQQPDLQSEIIEAQKLYAIMAINLTVADKKIALENFKKAILIEKQQSAPATVISIAASRKKWRYTIKVAAVLTGVLLMGKIWLTTKQSYSVNDTPITAFAKANYKEIVKSKADERRDVILADGSAITLNYGSTIKIADDYNQKKRWVYLEGEAFFSVIPDKQKPFVVITSKNATTALGTSFKVRNYNDEKTGDVMLATGKVKVQSMLQQSAKGDLILIPGEKANCENSNMPVKISFDLSILDNWRNLKIELDKASLDEIITALEFNYGVQVKLQNKPVKEFAFTGKFDKASLQNVLETISFTNKFSYIQKGNIISILFQ